MKTAIFLVALLSAYLITGTIEAYTVASANLTKYATSTN